MIYNISSEHKFTELLRYVTETLVVRSTTQKDESLSNLAGRLSFSLRNLEMGYYHLHGTGKLIARAIEGIVAHAQRGN